MSTTSTTSPATGFASIDGNRFLTGEQQATLVDNCRKLRIGHKLHAGAKAPYLVIVDGSYHWIRSVASLAKFLSGCTIPLQVQWFRNFDKGVTINLDVD